jgi:hypothetical protein
LILDFVDPKLKQLIWRDRAVDAVHRPQNLDDRLCEAKEKLLVKYPASMRRLFHRPSPGRDKKALTDPPAGAFFHRVGIKVD